MPVRPVDAICTSWTGTKTITGLTTGIINPANGRAVGLHIGSHRQAGELQSLEAGYLRFVKSDAARFYPFAQVDDDGHPILVVVL
jgi:hypothetical protein